MRAEETKLSHENASPVQDIFNQLDFSDDIMFQSIKKPKTPHKTDNSLLEFSDIESTDRTYIIPNS